MPNTHDTPTESGHGRKFFAAHFAYEILEPPLVIPRSATALGHEFHPFVSKHSESSVFDGCLL